MIAKFETESYLNHENDFILRAFIIVKYLTSPPHNLPYTQMLLRLSLDALILVLLFREGPEACEAWRRGQQGNKAEGLAFRANLDPGDWTGLF